MIVNPLVTSSKIVKITNIPRSNDLSLSEDNSADSDSIAFTEKKANRNGKGIV